MLCLFQNTSKKVTVRKNGKEKIIEVNREIIGTLLALSAKHEKPIFHLVLPIQMVPDVKLQKVP